MIGPEFPSLLRILLSLVVVLGLSILVLRFALPRLGGIAPERSLQTLEVRAIDNRHKMALVRARGEDILLGLGAGEVTLLRSWPTEPPEENSDAAHG